MFEHLDGISENSSELLGDLTPVTTQNVNALREKYPNCPDGYFHFLEERGVGGLEDGEMFFFEESLVDAESELFLDKEIYKFGAKGPIKIFGSEWSGFNYGFDTGDEWALVQVDTDRTVKKLDISFKKFIEGMFVCYPDYPVSYDDGKWTVATGEEYSLQSPST